ncbi:MAG: GTPase ObgE, partial [Candidatus Krumholzibacteriota bacterium]|nr:GTPase ObgE [Candidatus Krumholzibacteriota bacterium]
VLLFILDAADEMPADHAYRQLVNELRLYSEALLERPRYLALNKIDLLPERGKEVEFSGDDGERVFFISALDKTGVPELMKVLYRNVTALKEST